MPETKKTFEGFAEYYDLLYSDKDYTKEAAFVQSLLTKLGCRFGSMLDLGCGTGRHAARFVDYGWFVTGVDLSGKMIASAKTVLEKQPADFKKALIFRKGDMRSVRIRRKFDCVLSLFHSLGYQTTNQELNASFETAAVHLRSGGLFFFDFWFGPGVLSDRPSKRTKIVRNASMEISRTSEPRLDPRRNVVDITFRVKIKDNKTDSRVFFSEHHSVRYFFLPELEYFLGLSGFEIVTSGRWLSNTPLGASDWYGWIVAKKIA